MMNIKFMILTLRHRTLLSMHAYIHTDVRTYIYIYTHIYTPIIHTHMYICMNKGKGKAIPLHASTVPEGSRMLRLPVSKTIGGNVVSPRTGRLYPYRRYSWCSFLLEAESTPVS